MSMPGLGVMLRQLSGCGQKSVEAVQACIGKRILNVQMDGSRLLITMDAGLLILSDVGQSCCEDRYMTCDDDLTGFEGAELRSIEIRDAPDVDDEHGEAHEVQFLVIETTKGTITASTHNVHNGYYGGFCVEATLLTDGYN
jgi:hypothetical protein